MINLFNKSTELAYALYDEKHPLRTQVFSFAYLKNRLVCVGKNNPKTHPLNLRNPLLIKQTGEIYHQKGQCAELDMFIKIKNKTSIPFGKINVVNVRIDKNRQIKNSRPCNSCSSLLLYMNPKNVYHSNDFGQFEKYVEI